MRRLVLAVALLALLAGCSALPGGGPPPSDQRAVAAIDRANATAANIETYRFDVEMRVTASNDDRSKTVTVDGSGAANLSAKRMHVTTHVQDQTLHAYVDGYNAYQECAEPWGGYAVENVSRSEPWATATPLHRQLALFERSHVYWRGNRTVDGTRTHLVVAYPSRDTLRSLMDRRQTQEFDLDGSLENATARLWLDAETNRPVQSTLRLKISRGGATAVAYLEIDYRRYNDPANISIPPEVYEDENQYGLGCPGSA